MAPKKSKENTSVGFDPLRNLFRQLGGLLAILVCNFYLLLVRSVGEGIHTTLKVLFGLFREVLNILLGLAARLAAEVLFGVALIIEKIVFAILHLLLLLIVKTGTFMNHVLTGLVDLAGYKLSSAVFIAITTLVLWWTFPFVQHACHAISNLM